MYIDLNSKMAINHMMTFYVITNDPFLKLNLWESEQSFLHVEIYVAYVV